jgi:lipopolysaccharide export system protein LptA
MHLLRKLVLIIILTASLAAAAMAVDSKRFGNIDVLGWTNMEITGEYTIWTFDGGTPEFKTTDGSMYAKANKMVVRLYQKSKDKNNPTENKGIKLAELTGNVSFSAKSPDGRYIEGNCAKLTYDGAEQIAKLDGAGKKIQIKVMDNEAFEEPTTISGEIIRVNMKPNLGPDDWRVRVESSAEKSHITVTPKPKSENK